MARRDVTVELPVDDPDGTTRLVGRIIARNTAMGATSPIKDDFSFTDMETGNAYVKQLRTDADRANRISQSIHYRVLVAMGSAKGQNLESPGTLHTETTRIRNILLTKHKDNPEELELWGFDVVVSQVEGRRTVEVKIPIESPDEFIHLCEEIVEQNTTEGASSPLVGKIDMVAFESRTTGARTDFEEAEEERSIKESKHGEALNLLGYAPGQTIDTPNTVYNLIGRVRDLLLVAYPENPDELTRWGFKVVVKESSVGGNNAGGSGDVVSPPPVPQ